MSEGQLYKKGDRVKVKYGHLLWSNDDRVKFGKFIQQDGKTKLWDMRPELTEDIATVEYSYGEMSETDFRFSKGEQGYKQYSLKFDKHGSIAWFDEVDLIKVN